MMTLFAVLTIVYIAATTYASMAFASFCRRKFYWDEAGVALLLIFAFWVFPFTVATDMGWIR
jgi:hypothetical protein